MLGASKCLKSGRSILAGVKVDQAVTVFEFSFTRQVAMTERKALDETCAERNRRKRHVVDNGDGKW